MGGAAEIVTESCGRLVPPASWRTRHALDELICGCAAAGGARCRWTGARLRALSTPRLSFRSSRPHCCPCRSHPRHDPWPRPRARGESAPEPRREWQRHLRRRGAGLARAWCARSVVDVGCGTGRLTTCMQDVATAYLGVDAVRYDGFPAGAAVLAADLNHDPLPVPDRSRRRRGLPRDDRAPRESARASAASWCGSLHPAAGCS